MKLKLFASKVNEQNNSLILHVLVGNQTSRLLVKKKANVYNTNHFYKLFHFSNRN